MSNGPGSTVDPPRGTYPARVDDKGRLKLPAAFLEYLGALEQTKVFITTLDELTCKIYTIPAWNASTKLLREGPDKGKSKALEFLATHWGQDSELDPQGRFLLPTELRRALKMENAPVRMDAGDGVITVYSEEVYTQRLAKAREELAAKVEYMDSLGMR